MDLPLDSVGYLEILILFWGCPPQGGVIILEKLKNPNFPYMDRGRNPFAAAFAAPFAQIMFFFGKIEYRAERSEAI